LEMMDFIGKLWNEMKYIMQLKDWIGGNLSKNSSCLSFFYFGRTFLLNQIKKKALESFKMSNNPFASE
jgi:hypothetical protein